MTKNNKINSLSFILIVLAIFYSYYSQMPRFIKKEVPLTEFSTERALKQLAIIADKPHYCGTKEHTQVREYIVKELENLGLDVQIQEQEAVNDKWLGGVKTYNILTRIKGETNKALMLLTHYDSTVHSSYGGSDAGSGVVTILESIRAYISAGKKPKNDIIILISDAEELGLLGAKAFVKHHPWAKDVGLVLNLEARGSGGPSYMLLETNGGNHDFIEAFQKAKTPYPVSNSLMYSIYKMLPNDTDLTVFREDGDIDGFNFAFIDDFYDYHTALDTHERLDTNTLAHQGSYIMTLLDYFSEADLNQLKGSSDDVFFNFPHLGLVYYPFKAVLPTIVVVGLLFIILLIFGFKKQKLTLKGSVFGFIPFLTALFVAILLGHFGWKFLLYIFPQYQDILQGFTYNGYLYIIFFTSSTLGILFWLYHSNLKQIRLQDLMVAPLVVWIVINVVFALKLQGGGFFIIPLLILLIHWSFLLFSNKNPLKYSLFFTLTSLPILLLFSPLVSMFPVGLGLGKISISLVLLVLLFGSMLAVIGNNNNTKELVKLFFGIAVLSFITAYIKSGYSINQKQTSSIVFIQDIDKHQAFWASYNRVNDSFTEQFLGSNPEHGPLAYRFSSKFGTTFNLSKKTTTKDFLPPLINKTVNDSSFTDKNIYEYIIKPQRQSNLLYIKSKNNIDFYDIHINGEPFDKGTGKFPYQTTEKNKKIIGYYLAEGVDSLHIKMGIPKKQNPNFELFEISYDLMNNEKIDVIPRPHDMMPTPFVHNDAIILRMDL